MQNWQVIKRGSSAQFIYPIDGVPTPDTVSLSTARLDIVGHIEDYPTDALLSLTVTTAPADAGMIEDNGAGDGSGLVLFILSEAQTAALPVGEYFLVKTLVLSNLRSSVPLNAIEPLRIV
jgi:hypothetical protein